jgi:polynucleotide 5'-hydroxyl-kinase GRC3/NOL9
MDILPEWEQINVAQLRGTLLVVGAPDVGKSSFARYLYERLQAESLQVAYLDGDPGQSSMGPPTTMTLALELSVDDVFPPKGRFWRIFVGAPSPSGHMLPLLVGAARLIRIAHDVGTEVIVYDTSGLIDPAHGGAYLKLAKINLLRPTVVFAIQSNKELEYLLRPLRCSGRVRIMDMRPSPAVSRRDPLMRKAYRARQFARYFENAQPVTVDWSRMAVFPAPTFTSNRLVALEDANGFTLGLGIVMQIIRECSEVILHTPVTSMDEVDAINLGDVELDPQTFQEQI